ncbi:MAG: hypothetical protein K2J99_15885 [Lachnospiraceae bacterium]|nr:hypothetical protein [Lachnospiraceae bacterium]
MTEVKKRFTFTAILYLNVIEKYSEALDMLDSYDNQNMARPKGNAATYQLSYDECRDVIAKMRFGDESEFIWQRIG